MTGELFTTSDYANTCEFCESPTHDSLTPTARGALCAHCVEFFRYCSKCEELRHEDDIYGTNRSGDPICYDCTNSLGYLWCNSCDVLVLDRYYSHEFGECERCASEHTFTCDSCGDRTEMDYAYSNSRGVFCEYCYEGERPEGVHEYHEGAPWGIEFVDHGAIIGETRSHVGSAVYFGVEFEMEGCADYLGATLERAESSRDGHAETDSSVEGIEWISQPATLDAWRAEFGTRVRGYIAEFRGDGMDLAAPDCGQHVHVSRAAFAGDNHLARFAAFFVHNPEFVNAISGRDSVEQWASVKKYRAGELRDGVKYGHGDRYRAVNLRNSATVEIRIWAGTNEFDETLGAVEFVAALVEFTRGITVGDILAGALLADSFAAWLADSENATRYPLALALVGNRGGDALAA